MAANYFKIPANFFRKFEIRNLNWKNLDEVTLFVKKYNFTRSPIESILGERLEDAQTMGEMRINKKSLERAYVSDVMKKAKMK